ncbi:MAG: endopeptidase La [Candidatus Brocadiia bacterium]
MADEANHGETLPLIPLRNLVMFPGVITAVRVGRPRSVAALRASQQGGGVVVLVAQRQAAVEQPALADLYTVGVKANVRQIGESAEDEVLNVLLEGATRCRIEAIEASDPYMSARVMAVPEPQQEVPAKLRREVERLVASGPESARALVQMESLLGSFDLGYAVAFGLSLTVEDKQQILEEPDPVNRYRMLIPVLRTEQQIAAAGRRIREDAQKSVSEQGRRQYLAERKRELESSLAELTGEQDDLSQLRQRLDDAELPEEARREAERELARLANMPPGSPEFSVARDYLDWLAELPWHERTDASVDMSEAREILDRDHYDREEVKERIVEYLSVRQLNPQREGALLCFVGAPGVGKTSLGRSIAEATGRRFRRVSLGGVRDEAQIRGHRRTYIGAMPGRIIRVLHDVGVRNPVMMLDELDKLHSGLTGDPVSALLEALDPEQNATFVDNYLGVAFDLSDVMFIGTANTTETIPPPLLDRLEVIELPGYSPEEKLCIARQYLVPEQVAEAGLEPDRIAIEDEALELLIEGYTREAGVRNLERRIAALCRKVARRHLGGSLCYEHIDTARVHDLLGPAQHRPKRHVRASRPGVCATLAVGPAGGELMWVEVDRTIGGGKLIVTGRAGEALCETATLAHQFWRNRAADFGVNPDLLQESDFHVHLPGGAVPKEGTASGLAIALGFASVLCGTAVPEGVAAVGEITLHGYTRDVANLRERLAAARRAGTRRVVLPERSRTAAEHAARKAPLEGLELRYVKRVAEAVRELFPQMQPRPATV